MMKRSFFLFALLLSLTAMAQQRLRISILGDSYSTYQNYIPEGNEPWYFDPMDARNTDVNDVRQTWWWQVVKEGGYLLEKNESYSGATICYTGYNDDDYSARSFITRLPRVGSPDVLLIFGNTNDSWCGAKLGEYIYSNWKRADLYTYRPALAKLLNDAQCRCPNARIFFIQNTEIRQEIAESTDVICQHYGIPVIHLNNIEKKSGHPNQKGMRAISNQVLKAIGGGKSEKGRVKNDE